VDEAATTPDEAGAALDAGGELTLMGTPAEAQVPSTPLMTLAWSAEEQAA